MRIATENVGLINTIVDSCVTKDDLGIPALRNYPKPIKSFSEARSIRGVGEKTALKVRYLKSYRYGSVFFFDDGGRSWRSSTRGTSNVSSTKIRKMLRPPGSSKAYMALASTHRFLYQLATLRYIQVVILPLLGLQVGSERWMMSKPGKAG